MIEVSNYMPYHTKFAEDLFEYGNIKTIKLVLKDNYYVSELIDVQVIFNYCKKKYNYKNDEPHYFDNSKMINKIEPYYIYFDIIDNRFVIPLDTSNKLDNLVLFGKLNDIEIDKINMRLDHISFRIE